MISNIMVMSIWDAVKWIVCSCVCVIVTMFIFKMVTKSTDTIFNIFKRDYKKWNILIVAIILFGVIVCIAEGIEYTIHQEEYERMLSNAFMSSNFLDLLSGEVMLRNMIIFSWLRKVVHIAMLVAIVLPTIILARKTEHVEV